MLEIPEATTIARQLNETLAGRRVKRVVAGRSPHKFAWFHGEPDGYHDLLDGRMLEGAEAPGGKIDVQFGAVHLLFGDGVALRHHAPGDKLPDKHQLLVVFEDNSALSGSVQMYGGLWCFREGEFDNWYYDVARAKPSPLSPRFDTGYFAALIQSPAAQRLSAKAFLATEQRIPGFGNGVLHDTLYNARIHPKRKVNTLGEHDADALYSSLKQTLEEMTVAGGRDTEKDLFGAPGGYKSKLSSKSHGQPCPLCGNLFCKETYLGGAIYYCPECQPLL